MGLQLASIGWISTTSSGAKSFVVTRGKRSFDVRRARRRDTHYRTRGAGDPRCRLRAGQASSFRVHSALSETVSAPERGNPSIRDAIVGLSSQHRRAGGRHQAARDLPSQSGGDGVEKVQGNGTQEGHDGGGRAGGGAEARGRRGGCGANVGQLREIQRRRVRPRARRRPGHIHPHRRHRVRHRRRGVSRSSHRVGMRVHDARVEAVLQAATAEDHEAHAGGAQLRSSVDPRLPPWRPPTGSTGPR